MSREPLLPRLLEYEANNEPRRVKSCLYPLHHILFITLIGVICGCNDVVDVFDFAQSHEDWIQAYLGESYKTPCLRQIYNILSTIRADKVHEMFIDWMKEYCTGLQGVVALDGKTIKGSGDKSKRPAHIVSAFSADRELVLGQLACEKKSNEITAVPKLLKMLDVKGCIVTLDAMGTQTKIAKAIRDRDADYVLVAKGNQESTMLNVQEAIKTFMASGTGSKANLHITPEKYAHGRYVSQSCVVCNNVDLLDEDIRKKWPDLAGFGVIVTTTRTSLTETPVEVPTYYIYSVRNMTADKLLEIKADHWSTRVFCIEGVTFSKRVSFWVEIDYSDNFLR